jgi:hypothetical protein
MMRRLLGLALVAAAAALAQTMVENSLGAGRSAAPAPDKAALGQTGAAEARSSTAVALPGLAQGTDAPVKFTAPDPAQIQRGMDRQYLIRKFGEPAMKVGGVEGSHAVETWCYGSGAKIVTLKLFDGKVTSVIPLNQYGMPAVAAATDCRLAITSPSDGTMFAPGDAVNLTVQITGLAANDVGVDVPGFLHLDGVNHNGSTYQASFQIPEPFAGFIRFQPAITDTGNNPIYGVPIRIRVRPPKPLTSIAFLNPYETTSFTPPQSTAQLYVRGTYSDGTQLDLTSSAAGTTYVSSNPSVVSVSPEGLGTIGGEGIAIITASNGPASVFLAFVVEDPASPLAPIPYTSSAAIRSSGLVFNPQTGLFVETLTVTNVSALPIPGKLALVFQNLPNGVTLYNQSGLTSTILPAGNSYIRIPVDMGTLTLAPGKSASVQAQFLSFKRVPVTHSLSVFRYSMAQ